MVCFQESQCNVHDHNNAKTLKKGVKKGADPILNLKSYFINAQLMSLGILTS